MTGLSFGLTSGVITTLGLIVGLHAGTHSRMVVIGGILTVAVSDAMSDALGIHISEEAKKRGSARHCHNLSLPHRPVSSQRSNSDKCDLGPVPTHRPELLRRRDTSYFPMAGDR